MSSTADRTAADHAFVTLITSDDYLPGALAQSAALNDLHPTRRGGPFPKSGEVEEEPNPVPFTTVCLVTPETVSIETIKQLRRTFDLVIGVEVIEGDKDAEEIRLLGRPDLYQTFTKLHVLRLVQFASLVFLDADVLPLRPLSHLLDLVSSWPDDYFHGDSGEKTPTTAAPGITSSGPAPFLTDSSKIGRNPRRLSNPDFPCPVSAAPDSGWPDIFNSGVIVLAPPGERGFKEAMGLRSWDGGDQGTLNEWAGRQSGLAGRGTGGSGWNRLSFKYNVTPTAAYTYAPAYAKFGTAIHAVHFIGSGKPWAGLPFRPPFISGSGRSAGKYVIGAYGSPGTTIETKTSAYGYHALVDRWYAVYDAHFRVEESNNTAPKSDFELRHYESAWDAGKPAEEFAEYDGGTDSGAQTKTVPSQSNQYPHVVPPYTYHVAAHTTPAKLPPAATSAATLEELRRLALHGVGGADPARIGEGSYISLPLEGRISLMRPPPPPRPEPAPVVHHHEPEPQHHHHETHHGTHHETHHHETHHETHHHEPHHHEPHHHEPHHHETHHHETHHEPHHEPYHEPHHETYHEPPRPLSPPIISWNPAVEPPPTTLPSNAQPFPENTYAQNQWDMPHQDASQFFTPPPPTEIPKHLIQEGHYSALTAHNFEPDRTQIKNVFPWEENSRPAPERTFPDSAPPPPPAPHLEEPALVPAPTRVFPPDRPRSPARELGSAYANAWDEIPSIQRYAARLMGYIPPPAQAPPPPPVEPLKPEKEWSWEQDGGEADASSRDGDDEDDEDEGEGEDEDEVPGQAKPKAQSGVVGAQDSGVVTNGANGTNGTSRPKLGSRSGSRSASGSGSRSGSVPRTSDPAAPTLQTLSQSTPTPGRNGNASLKGFGAYLAEKRKAQGALEGRMDVRSRVATLGAGTPAFMYPLGIEPQLPGLIWAPTPDAPTAAGEDGDSSPSMAEPSFEFTRPSRITLPTLTSLSVAGTLGSTLDMLSHTRTISSEHELTDDSSLPPSPGVSSASELERSPPPPPARTFDEARSVDAFKHNSHETLARFLRMGSWGGETP